MDNIAEIIKHNGLTQLMLCGNYGLELENIRADSAGYIATTPHPVFCGDKSTNKYITTDFAEAQIELITPILNSTQELLTFMQTLHSMVLANLDEEYMWPYSLPPILPDNDDSIKIAQFANPEITQYRAYLANKYGKQKQLICGIHYNFSLNSQFLDILYSKAKSSISSKDFTNQIYLKVARNYLKYSPLITYLFGASPVFHKSYLSCCTNKYTLLKPNSYKLHNGRSFRSGINGYRNLNQFYVSYNSLTDYVADVNKAITNGYIVAAKEYYSQVRLKGHNKDNVLADLTNNGISYLEIRSLDINPDYAVGVNSGQLDFLKLLLLYCMISPDIIITQENYMLFHNNQIAMADGKEEQSIILDMQHNIPKNIKQHIFDLLNSMCDEFVKLGVSAEQLLPITTIKNKLHQNITVADNIINGIYTSDYVEYMLALAKNYKNSALQQYKLWMNNTFSNKQQQQYFNQIMNTLNLQSK
jgi:glutamate--cysteine ligase